MTKALDAAIRAYCEYDEQVTNCRYPECKCDWQPDIVRAALRAALPAEPTAEAIAVMTAAAAAGWPRHEFRDAYRALRAHLLKFILTYLVVIVLPLTMMCWLFP